MRPQPEPAKAPELGGVVKDWHELFPKGAPIWFRLFLDEYFVHSDEPTTLDRQASLQKTSMGRAHVLATTVLAAPSKTSQGQRVKFNIQTSYGLLIHCSSLGPLHIQLMKYSGADGNKRSCSQGPGAGGDQQGKAMPMPWTFGGNVAPAAPRTPACAFSLVSPMAPMAPVAQMAPMPPMVIPKKPPPCLYLTVDGIPSSMNTPRFLITQDLHPGISPGANGGSTIPARQLVTSVDDIPRATMAILTGDFLRWRRRDELPRFRADGVADGLNRAAWRTQGMLICCQLAIDPACGLAEVCYRGEQGKVYVLRGRRGRCGFDSDRHLHSPMLQLWKFLGDVVNQTHEAMGRYDEYMLRTPCGLRGNYPGAVGYLE